MSLPAISLLRRYDTHRLIPSKYSQGGDSVLARIADDDAHLRDIFDLDHATNERLLAENDRLPGIDTHELVFGVPYYRIVNAAFCHAHPLGSRFNDPDRGAWYAAFEVESARAEVAFHKAVELAEVGWFHEEATYDDYLADFSADFHDIRDDKAFADCLAADSYVASQGLARQLLAAGSLGVVYPSVRKQSGTCLACFRPALVMNVRKDATHVFRWEGRAEPVISTAKG
ncbi:RES family NAD+ phosphorylase [Taklimakanibacter lacteus]|uniref:RES family NAD+ phosphorylase n=1 Tax=Taklimakanibacter lacteus TaxID=2268456 RepID=UPI000E66D5A2